MRRAAPTASASTRCARLIKDDRWRDNPPDPAWREGDDPYRALIPEYTTDRAEVLELVALMRERGRARAAR